MSSRAEELEQRLELEKQELTNRLHRIQDKLEDVTNPKVIYREHPAPMLAVAFCGGMLLGALTAPQSHHHLLESFDRLRDGRRDRQRDTHPGTLRQLRNAAVGIAVARLSEAAMDRVTRLLGRSRRRRARPAG